MFSYVLWPSIKIICICWLSLSSQVGCDNPFTYKVAAGWSYIPSLSINFGLCASLSHKVSQWLYSSCIRHSLTVLTKWLHLVTELTTTMMASFPLYSGSSTIKLTLAVSQGASRIGRGCSCPDGGWKMDLVLVLGSPVTGPEKDHNQTRLWPIRTANYQDQQRP